MRAIKWYEPVVNLVIVLVSGTPGVGKTAVAKQVAERMSGVYVNVAELARREGLVLGYDAERDAYIVDEVRVRERLRHIARGKLTVVDTHVISVVPPEEVEIAIVLRLDPRELERRLRSRGYPESKVFENVQAEILDACVIEAVELLGEQKVFEVDGSGKTLEQVVEEVVGVIKNRRGMKPGSVNWLERLGSEVLRYLRHI